jgi:DNA-binding transcriptional ArsR family regulator
MAKHDKTGRSKGDAKHVRLYEHMEKTDAWRGLSGIAAKAWFTVGLMHNGLNNGRIGVSTRELGERIGVTHSTAARALRELENAGFLRCVRASSFSRKRLAAEYELTHIGNAVTGASATKDYLRRNRPPMANGADPKLPPTTVDFPKIHSGASVTHRNIHATM